MMNKKVLTIAGSDSSGGAGVQADLKTMCAWDVYGMSVITSVTAQNTLGVQRVDELPPESVAAQIASVAQDIRPDAVKIGMVCSAENVKAIAEAIESWELTNVVLDPVMVSTSGHELLRPGAAEAMQQLLFPKVSLVTPNVPEAERLSGSRIKDAGSDTRSWMEETARNLHKRWGAAFLIKGGHLQGEAADFLYDGSEGVWFTGQRIETNHTHGTGCTLSAAIACGLAKGCSLKEAVGEAKEYLTGCVLYHPQIGHGAGPLNHLWRIEKAEAIK